MWDKRRNTLATPSRKASTQEFLITGGNCAANAAIAIARLGGEGSSPGPLDGDELVYLV
jgi:sugar/nucleoside kinase (ribokinase family)